MALINSSKGDATDQLEIMIDCQPTYMFRNYKYLTALSVVILFGVGDSTATMKKFRFVDIYNIENWVMMTLCAYPYDGFFNGCVLGRKKNAFLLFARKDKVVHLPNWIA